MKHDIKKVIMSTAIAKLCNENVTENRSDFSFNVRMKEDDMSYLSEQILDGAFDFLEPISVQTGQSLLIFKANKDDFQRIKDVRNHVVNQSNKQKLNMFDLDYDGEETLIKNVINKINEADIKQFRLDRVLESNVKYHFEPNNKDINKMNIFVNSDNRENLSFSTDKNDTVISMLQFAEKTKHDFRRSLGKEQKNEITQKTERPKPRFS